MTTVGRSNIEITATDRQARRTISNFFRDLENTGQRIGQAMRRVNPFEAIYQGTNQSAQFLERYKARFLSAIDQMNAKATQSKKMMDILPETSRIQRIDRFFLGIGDRLEQMAKKGTAANLAISMLGRNANLKDIMERIKLINQGLARMQALATTSAIVLGVFTAGMVKLSNTVDGRLLPAVTEFKRVWLSALKPFARIWTDFALKVIDAGTAVGHFIDRLNQVNPAITQMIGMFLYLFTAITLFLSPMAIGIGRALGMRAAFTVLFNSFKPLILGFLRVAGMASLVSGALVILGGILIRLWQNSETFRNSLINAWNSIKSAVLSAVQPLIPSLELLWSSFILLLNTFTGGGLTIQNFWKSLGDAVGNVINLLVTNGIPLLQGALRVIVIILQGLIDGLTNAFNALWPIIQQIVAYIQGIFTSLQKSGQASVWISQLKSAFLSFLQFLGPIMGQIAQIIGQAFTFIGQIIRIGVMIWVALIRTAWSMIQAILSNPIVVAVVRAVWATIKTVISNALNLILNVLRLFSNLLSGNWSAAWQDLKSIAFSLLNILTAGIRNILVGLANQALTWGRNLLNNFISGVRSRFSALIRTVKEAAGTVSDYLGFHSPAKKGPGADADKWFVNLMEMLEASIRIRIPHLRAVSLDAAQQLNAINALNLGGTLQRAGFVSSSASESVQQVHNEVHIYAQEAPLTEERLIRYLRRMDWLR